MSDVETKPEVQTAYEVADEFRCSTRKVTDIARANRIGVNLGGRAGWRFNRADVLALWEAMRPPAPIEVPRRRRRASR